MAVRYGLGGPVQSLRTTTTTTTHIAIIFASGVEALSLVLDIAAGGFGWLGEGGSADFGHHSFAIIFACNYFCIVIIFAKP